MNTPSLARPEEIGIDAARVRRAHALLEQWAERDLIPGGALAVGRKGRMLEPRFFGRQGPEKDAAPLRDDALFLVASITKPITVTAVMILVERGLVTLEDPVASFVPAFAAKDKGAVTVRHLMTHTSGLPDMVGNNLELRKAHRPLSAFIEAICQEPLLFPPGTKVSYQSAGTAMLGEIVHQVSGRTIAEFLRQEIFLPLGLKDTSLGWQPDRKERIARLRVPREQEGADWGWNSPYWLGFGAPWGGLVTSPAELARVCQMMLGGGRLGDVRLLSPATVRAMTANQLETMPGVPEEDRRCRPWGLGWRLSWPADASSFSDLIGPRAFGHWGATGTVCWVDPDSDGYCIVLTTQPQDPEDRFLRRVCNIVAGAFEK